MNIYLDLHKTSILNECDWFSEWGIFFTYYLLLEKLVMVMSHEIEYFMSDQVNLLCLKTLYVWA